MSLTTACIPLHHVYVAKANNTDLQRQFFLPF